jgi:hypothetical protein
MSFDNKIARRRNITGSQKRAKRLPELFFGFSHYDFLAAGSPIIVSVTVSKFIRCDVFVIGRGGVHQDPPGEQSG